LHSGGIGGKDRAVGGIEGEGEFIGTGPVQIEGQGDGDAGLIEVEGIGDLARIDGVHVAVPPPVPAVAGVIEQLGVGPGGTLDGDGDGGVILPAAAPAAENRQGDILIGTYLQPGGEIVAQIVYINRG